MNESNPTRFAKRLGLRNTPRRKWVLRTSAASLMFVSFFTLAGCGGVAPKATAHRNNPPATTTYPISATGACQRLMEVWLAFSLSNPSQAAAEDVGPLTNDAEAIYAAFPNDQSDQGVPYAVHNALTAIIADCSAFVNTNPDFQLSSIAYPSPLLVGPPPVDSSASSCDSNLFPWVGYLAINPTDGRVFADAVGSTFPLFNQVFAISDTYVADISLEGEGAAATQEQSSLRNQCLLYATSHPSFTFSSIPQPPASS